MRSGCRFTDNKTGNIRRDHDHNDVEQKRPEKKPKDNDQPIGGPDYPSDSGGRMSSGRSLPRCLEFFWTVGDRSAEEFRRTDGCHEDGVIRQAKMRTACAARDARSDSGGDELFVAWGRRVKEQRKRRCTLASTYMMGSSVFLFGFFFATKTEIIHCDLEFFSSWPSRWWAVYRNHEIVKFIFVMVSDKDYCYYCCFPNVSVVNEKLFRLKN
jgi:hypothetical protein